MQLMHCFGYGVNVPLICLQGKVSYSVVTILPCRLPTEMITATYLGTRGNKTLPCLRSKLMDLFQFNILCTL